MDWALPSLVALAFLLEAILGFGSTVIVVTVGAQFLPLDVLLPTYVPVNMLLSGYLVVRYRDQVDGALLVRRILPFMGLGLVAGLCVPGTVPRPILLGGFGVFVMALALPEVWALVRPSTGVSPTARPPLSRGAAAAVLGAGGFIHGLFGSGGPMVVYFTGRERLDKAAFRATLSALWLVLNAVLVGSFVSRGLLDESTLLRSAGLLPALLLGAVIGEVLHARVDVKVFRALVYTLLFAAGMSLALRSFFA